MVLPRLPVTPYFKRSAEEYLLAEIEGVLCLGYMMPAKHIGLHVSVFFFFSRNLDSKTMKLTDQVIKTFKTAKIFRDNTDVVNSINYSHSGDTLISSSDDDQIVIYDCQNGTYVALSMLTRVQSKSKLPICIHMDYWLIFL
mgnify:CR=1 FL=1